MNKKHVLVTGGAGFIGSHLVELLKNEGANVTVADNLENGKLTNLHRLRINFIRADLRNLKNCIAVTKGQDIVMNLAAKVGGIHYNKKHQAEMFYHNLMINSSMLEAARINDIEKFLVVSSACVYPRYCKVPTPETEGFKGEPEPTNKGYGWAKRIAEKQAEFYSKEYGMKIGIVRPYNCIGPRDHFNPEKSHVVPALIKRIYDGENPIVVWGDGEQTRSFIYVKDLVRGMLLAIQKYPKPDPLNLGSKEEIKIIDLIKLIIELSGKNVNILFDKYKPRGQPRRKCDVRKAEKKIGFVATTTLKDALRETINWYEKVRGLKK